MSKKTRENLNPPAAKLIAAPEKRTPLHLTSNEAIPALLSMLRAHSQAGGWV